MDYEDHEMLQRFMKKLHDEDAKARQQQTQQLIEAFNNVAKELRLLREELSPKRLDKGKLPPPGGELK